MLTVAALQPRVMCQWISARKEELFFLLCMVYIALEYLNLEIISEVLTF